MPFYSPLTNVQPYGLYKNISASALIKTGEGELQAVIINSHSSGTLKLWDNTSAATTVICNTITFSAVATTGERWIPFFGLKFNTGCYATIGGTADLTFIYN
jgi:hypothetical protein